MYLEQASFPNKKIQRWSKLIVPVFVYLLAVTIQSFFLGSLVTKQSSNLIGPLIFGPNPLEEVIIIGEQTTVYCSTFKFRAVPIKQFITENYNQVDVDGFLYMLNDHIVVLHLFVCIY
jgi:hypothetical protein